MTSMPNRAGKRERAYNRVVAVENFWTGRPADAFEILRKH